MFKVLSPVQPNSRLLRSLCDLPDCVLRGPLLALRIYDLESGIIQRALEGGQSVTSAVGSFSLLASKSIWVVQVKGHGKSAE